MATPDTYVAGSVKQDPASKAVAVRTTLLSPDGAMDWGVMTTNAGGHYEAYEGVQDWDDLPNTPVPDPPPAPEPQPPQPPDSGS
jgi:hypothetical protein